MIEYYRGGTDYVSFVLPVDDLDWTGQWLEKEHRCDLVVVFVAKRDDVSPRYRLRAVEAKASGTADSPAPRLDVSPFDKGAIQVVETLESLWPLIDPEGDQGLVEDLKYASFMEHLMATVLSGIETADLSPSALEVFERVSSLSLRKLSRDDIEVDGLVVYTAYGTAVEPDIYEGAKNGWPIKLIRVGADEVTRLVADEESVVEGLEERSGQYRREDQEDGKSGDEQVEEVADEGVEPENGGRDEGDDAEAGEASVWVHGGEEAGKEEIEVLAKDIYASCRQRDFPVGEPDISAVSVGPSLVTIPMELESGASKRPIENATEDLAREVGAPRISVENDPERSFHIRFVVARRDRDFVSLPDRDPNLVHPEKEQYFGLMLGVELDGALFESYVSSWPHMLIGGSTGSGKTTFIRSLLRQFIRLPAEALNLVVIDGKAEVDYTGIIDRPYFADEFPELLLGAEHALDVMEWLVEEEIPRRRRVVRDVASSTRDVRGARQVYVESARKGEFDELFSPIVLVIDEFSELMLRESSRAALFEEQVQQVAQAGRSTLVHLILATQRPASSVVKGSIKANLDARVALRVPTHHDSMTILGGEGADKLLGRGDMLFQKGGDRRVRLQGFDA